jgi:TRAP-type transport system small permease protein
MMRQAGFRYGLLPWLDNLIRASSHLAKAALFGIVLLITTDVLLRNTINVSILISDEVSGYLMVSMVFFGAGHSLRTGSFLRIEFILVALPERVKASVNIIFDVLALAVSFTLFYELVALVFSTWERKMYAATLIQTPLWIPQLAMPLGSAILICALLLNLNDNVALLCGRKPPIVKQEGPEFEAMS